MKLFAGVLYSSTVDKIVAFKSTWYTNTSLNRLFIKSVDGRATVQYVQPLTDGHISEGILPGPDWADIKDHGISSSFSAIP